MRKTIPIAALTLALGAGLLAPSAADASTWFAAGSGFRLGPGSVSFVFGHPGPWVRPSYYVRFATPISYRGHRCSRACFHEAGYYYHDRHCPVVVAHFDRYGYDRDLAFRRYAPRIDYGYDRGYHGRDAYRYRSYAPYGRYDRRHDGRRDRYDGRRDRHDGRRDRYDGRRDRHDGRRDRYDGHRGHRHDGRRDH